MNLKEIDYVFVLKDYVNYGLAHRLRIHKNSVMEDCETVYANKSFQFYSFRIVSTLFLCSKV